jgi:2-iminobutanoate/2-iminopropanoate deaminase
MAGGHAALHLVEMGGMLFSSPIHGADPTSGALSSDPATQFEAAFENLQRLLQLAGADVSNVGIVKVNLGDKSNASLIDKPWRATFPDATVQPTRKVNVYGLQSDMKVQLEITGVRGQSPRALKAPSLRDEGFPSAVRIGDMMFSTGIDGRDPETGRLSDDREVQVRQAYANLQTLLTDAGGSWDDVLHVYAFLDRLRAQTLMHEVWEGIFTTHGQCPARKAIHYGAFDDEATILQLQAVAVLGARDRRDFLLENVPVHETGTMGAAIGDQMRSCGLSGNPGGKLETLDQQIEWAFKHMHAFMHEAGGSVDNIGQVSILVRNYDDVPRILETWRKEFADRDDQPAHTWAAFGLNPSNAERVQFQIAGVL